MLFPDKHLTFHIGDDKVWHNPKYRGLYDFNHAECELALRQLQTEFGEFDATQIGNKKLKMPGFTRRLLRHARSFLRTRPNPMTCGIRIGNSGTGWETPISHAS